MHDLEKQIRDWRRSMAQTSKHRTDALDELELHLRQELDRLVQAGSTPEEAFKVAVAKLGFPAALGAEFDKLEQMRRSRWLPATLAQWACIAIAVLAVGFLVPRIGHGRMTPLLASHVLPVTIGYPMMFIIGGLAICHVLAIWLHRATSSQAYALQRTIAQLATISAVLTGIAIILGMVWAKENWGRYWAWDAKETGATIVLLCAVLTAAFAVSKRRNALIIMGIVGNIATAWGWFGVNAKQFTPLLTAFVAGHLLLMVAFVASTIRARSGGLEVNS